MLGVIHGCGDRDNIDATACEFGEPICEVELTGRNECLGLGRARSVQTGPKLGHSRTMNVVADRGSARAKSQSERQADVPQTKDRNRSVVV